jgi:hypothetical protein
MSECHLECQTFIFQATRVTPQNWVQIPFMISLVSRVVPLHSTKLEVVAISTAISSLTGFGQWNFAIHLANLCLWHVLRRSKKTNISKSGSLKMVSNALKFSVPFCNVRSEYYHFYEFWERAWYL